LNSEGRTALLSSGLQTWEGPDPLPSPEKKNRATGKTAGGEYQKGAVKPRPSLGRNRAFSESHKKGREKGGMKSDGVTSQAGRVCMPRCRRGSLKSDGGSVSSKGDCRLGGGKEMNPSRILDPDGKVHLETSRGHAGRRRDTARGSYGGKITGYRHKLLGNKKKENWQRGVWKKV